MLVVGEGKTVFGGDARVKAFDGSEGLGSSPLSPPPPPPPLGCRLEFVRGQGSEME